MKEKVVLAYSGGLDTTALIPWLKETFDYDVVCCCVNCGQGNELDGLDERAKLSGASKLYIEDIVDEFCDDFIVPCVQAGAVYEHKYLLGTSMARPAIAKKLVEIARKEGAVAICHGATLAIVACGTMRVLRDQKHGKLLQFGERIWGIADGTEEERIDRTIARTEEFFRSLGLSTRLSQEGIGEATIAEIERRFNAEGVAYGEAGNVTGAVARRILEACL